LSWWWRCSDAVDGRHGVELRLEALPPDTLARILTSAIEVNLDSNLLAEARAAEDQERRQITRALPSAD
jgi:hypothetical protein